MMSNKQQAENFLKLAKRNFGDNTELAAWQLDLAKVHALLALEEATRLPENHK